MKYSSLEIYSLPFYVYFKNLYVCYIRKIYLIYIFAILIQLIFDIYLKIYILIENIQLIFSEDKGKIEQKV